MKKTARPDADSPKEEAEREDRFRAKWAIIVFFVASSIYPQRVIDP